MFPNAVIGDLDTFYLVQCNKHDQTPDVENNGHWISALQELYNVKSIDFQAHI